MTTAFILGGLIFIHVVWAVTDRRPIKERILIYTHPRSMKTGILIVATILLVWYSGLTFPWSSSILDELFTWSGIGLYLVGLTFAAWAKVVMKGSWGPPGQHDKSRQSTLIITGPFRYTRNPIYLGLLAMVFGAGLAMRSYLTVLVIPLYFYLRNQVKKEESALENIFGKSYRVYKRHVPRFLI